MLPQFGVALDTLFDELNSLMQDLPNYAAEPMGDGASEERKMRERPEPACSVADLAHLQQAFLLRK